MLYRVSFNTYGASYTRCFTDKQEPINGRSFTYKQMQEVYRDLANKEEYPDFDCWFTDMLKSGVFETI